MLTDNGVLSVWMARKTPTLPRNETILGALWELDGSERPAAAQMLYCCSESTAERDPKKTP